MILDFRIERLKLYLKQEKRRRVENPNYRRRRKKEPLLLPNEVIAFMKGKPGK